MLVTEKICSQIFLLQRLYPLILLLNVCVLSKGDENIAEVRQNERSFSKLTRTQPFHIIKIILM